jgi:hypothetical protein
MRPAAPPFNPVNLAMANQAWSVYQAARRRVWTFAPHAERRYLRTQDLDGYVADRRAIIRAVDSATRGWVASLRRIFGRHAHAVPLGTSHLGMPSCFMVRVPAAGSMAMHERRWGSLPLDEPKGAAQREIDRAARAKAREEFKPQLHEIYYRKMVAALTESRQCAALKEHVLVLRTKLKAPKKRLTPEQRAQCAGLTRRSYLYHGRAMRCWARAVAYQKRLHLLGLEYHLALIATPIDLPEEGESHGLSQETQARGTGGREPEARRVE